MSVGDLRTGVRRRRYVTLRSRGYGDSNREGLGCIVGKVKPIEGRTGFDEEF